MPLKDSKNVLRYEFVATLAQNIDFGDYRTARLADRLIRQTNALRALIASSDDGCGGMRGLLEVQEEFDARVERIKMRLSRTAGEAGLGLNFGDVRGPLVFVRIPGPGFTLGVPR